MIAFTPVRCEPATLEVFLDHAARVDGIEEWWVYDDNTDPASSRLLADADVKVLEPIDGLPESTYARTEQTHQWPDGAVSRVAAVKNHAIDRFLSTDSSHLFLVDSDVILQPGTVRHLRDVGVPVVSAVYWSQWTPGSPWMPNVWDHSHYQFTNLGTIARLREPGDYEVGGLGACTLIDRRLLEHVRFEPIKNWPMWGEDRWFTMRCGVLGIPLVACTHVTPFHVYRSSQLDEARDWSAARAQAWVQQHLDDRWIQALITPAA